MSLNKTDIGKPITLRIEAFDKFYFVEQGLGSSGSLLVYLADSTPVPEETIEVTATSALFFDPDGNYYCLNSANKIAQYNFTTLELDELEGQSAIPWTKKFIARLADGSFMTSRAVGYPDEDTYMQRYSLDGTLLEEVLLTVTGVEYYVNNIPGNIIGSFATDGTYTSINVPVVGAWYVLPVTPTYTASGLLSAINISETDPRFNHETGGTIYFTNLFTLDGTDLIVRDILAGYDPIQYIPIPKECTGSIGLKIASEENALKVGGILRSIYVSPESKAFLPGEEEGTYTPIWTPGYRVITITTADTTPNALKILSDIRGVNTFEIDDDFYTIQDIEEVDSRETLITLIHRQVS